ncbi:Membrane protein TVP38 [Ceratobasidium theobromae]|uniref:Golgi apparatus membrane protein TVP38 n=1 Tax=Ceratobasidium theobromae TaxID=1582974 RepID=A0A5N5QGI5_9AGAM|nr:Membrane protein TVP38 [Ceratobasidium theobromae]
MTTLAPHPVQPTPSPGYITYSNRSESEFQYSSVENDTVPLTGRGARRPSSPTPSEKEELKEFDGLVRKMLRKENWKDVHFIVTVVVIVIIITIVILLSVFNKQIVKALTPAAEWVKKAPAGWLIPIAILVVLSIPPLIGAEIVHILCGLVYGVWAGFLVVCAGTVIGEVLTFYLFRYCLRSRTEKLERGKGSLQSAALARVIREGGFWVAIVIRYSAIPTHITTAVFASCGMNFWTFLITLTLSLPRQLAGVYIGVLAREEAEGNVSKKDKIVSNVVLGVTIAITIIAMRWVSARMKSAGLVIIRERRAREAAEIEAKPFDPQAPYDPASATGTWSGTTNSNVYFGTRTPSPVPPYVSGGGGLPVMPGPAQIRVQSV